MTTAIRLAHAELRRSWRQLLGVALVVVVGAGGVMLTLAGARRADTSFDRFRSSVDDGHVFIGVEEAPDRLADLAGLPTVEKLAPFGYVKIIPRNAPPEASIEGGGFASNDGTWLYDVQRPRVLAGTMPAPDETDRMAVNEVFATQFKASPGDVLHMEAASADAVTGAADHDEVVPVDLEVAAIVRTPLDIGGNAGGPIVYLPPGFLPAHPEIGVVPGFGMARLRGGDGSFPQFQREATAALGDEPSFTVGLISEEGSTVQRALDVQVIALRIVAAVLALSAGALLLQLAPRRIRRTANATAALRTLGATRAQRMSIVAGPLLVAAAAGILLGASASVALSQLLPRGLARIAEPDPGPYLDVRTIAGVGLATMLVTSALLVLSALRATQVTGQSVIATPGLGDRLVRRHQQAGSRLPMSTGVRLALPSTGTDHHLTGLVSLVGLVVGLAGLIAATAFGARLSNVVADTHGWGTPFELYVEVDDPGASTTELAADVAETNGVQSVTTVRYADVVDLGEVEAQGFGVSATKGDLAVTAVEGRAPSAEGEVLLGTATAAALQHGVGDTLQWPSTGSSPVSLTIVGLGLLPIIGDGSYDTGIVVLPDTFARLRHDAPRISFWVGVGDGSTIDEVATRLSATGASVGPIEPPSELRNLRSVLSYPKVVSGIAALLALGGLASGLLAGTASRRHEMATLRAIGYTGRQVREAVLWQSLTVGLMALTAAVPLGLIVTNWAWRVGAGSLSLDRSLGLPWPTAAVVAAGLLVVAAATAVPIGRGWARRSLALDLRTE